MTQEKSPIRPTNDEARALAQNLMHRASFGALAVKDPATGTPYVARVAVGQCPDGKMVTLVSDLSHHTRALRASPDCSLLIGEPEEKGDPLTYPRITLMAKAHFIDRDAPERKVLRDHYLLAHPKARNVLILGAGTVSRSLVEAFRAGFPGCTVTLWNRTPERARELARELDAEVAVDAGEPLNGRLVGLHLEHGLRLAQESGEERALAIEHVRAVARRASS